MDGFFDFLTTASSGSVPAGIVIAAAVLIVGVIVAIAVLRFTAPIGEGTGHAIAKVGDSVEDIAAGVGAIGHGVGRTIGGPGALMESWGKAAETRADNEREDFVLKLSDGLGHEVFVQAHGPLTAPKMPDVMGGVPMLPAPPAEAQLLLASPKRKKGGK